MDDRVAGIANYDQDCDQKIQYTEPREYATPYTFKGVLHFLQSELNRLDMERSDWETERAELNTRIAFLEGERRGQENLKKDLVRRIKMLEYALKQERVMIHKYRSSLMTQKQQNVEGEQQQRQQVQNSGPHSLQKQPQQLKAELVEALTKCTERTVQSNADWRNSRAQLKKFLQEIDCTDGVLTVRQARLLRMMESTPAICREVIKESPGDIHHPRSKVKANRPGDAVKGSLSSAELLNDSDDLDPDADPDDEDDDDEYMRRVHFEMDQQFDKNQRCVEDHRDYLMHKGNHSRTSSVLSIINSLTKSPRSSAGDQTGPGRRPMIVQKEYTDSPEDALPWGANIGKTVGPPAESAQSVTTSSTSSDDLFTFPSVGSQLPTPGSDTGPSENLVLGDLAGLTVTNELESGVNGQSADPTRRSRFQPTTMSSFTEPTSVPQSVGAEQADHHRVTPLGSGAGEGAVEGGGESNGSTCCWDLLGTAGCSPSSDSDRRHFWSTQISLRGHLDAVRAIAFHPTEKLAYSAGEDGCVMLWNLAKCRRSRASVLPVVINELEPTRIYTGHRGPVLCLAAPSPSLAAVSSRLSACLFTGGLDGTVRGWHAPASMAALAALDMYAPYDEAAVAGPVLSGPSNKAVWSLALHSRERVLVAGHSDGTVDFWQVNADSAPDAQLMRSLSLSHLDNLPVSTATYPLGRPTCLHFAGNHSDEWVSTGGGQGFEPHCLLGTSTGWLFLLDVETGQVVSRCSPPPTLDGSRTADQRLPASWSPVGTYCATSQETLSLVITGHEDGHLRFYDLMRLSSERCLVATTTSTSANEPDISSRAGDAQLLPIEGMLAHTDAVSSMATDNGHLLVTGSHDASMRVWIMDERTSITEITNHRFKHKEAIHSVAFHPKHSLVASAGADGTCNVYAIGS